MADEISGGDRPPVRSRPARTALLVLIGVAVVIAAVVSLRRGVEPPVQAIPTGRALPDQMPDPPLDQVPPLLTPALALGDVCRPLRPSGPDTLAVSFSLRNNSSRTTELTAVAPKLPLGGLKERGYSVRSGTCAGPGRPLTDNRLGHARPVEVASATFVVATLYFELPDECPAPYPVQAVISEQADSGSPTINTEYPLLADLSGVPFANC